VEVLLNLNRLILAFALVTNVTLAFYVVFNNYSKRLNRLLSFLILSVAVWVLSSFLILFADNVSSILFLKRLGLASFSFIAFLWVYFTFTFPTQEEQLTKTEKSLLFAPALLFVVSALFTPWLIKDFVVINSYPAYLGNTLFGFMYPAYIFYFIIYSFWGMANLALKFADNRRPEKLQLLYVLFGITFAFICGLLMEFIMPLVGIYDFYSIEPLFALIAVFFAAYAVIHAQFLNIEDFLVKGFGIILAVVLFLGTFFSVVTTNFYFLLTFYIICIEIFLAVSILFRDWRGTTNRAFSLVALSAAAWTFSIFMYGVAGTPSDALFWSRLALYFASFIPVFFACFVRVFPREENINVWEWTVLFVPAISLAVLSFSRLLIVDVVTQPWGYQLVVGLWFILYAFYFVFTMAYAFYLLFRKYFVSSGVFRFQIGCLFFGFFIGSLFICFSNIILPIFGNSHFVGFGPYFSLIPIIFLIYAIGRYKFMGLELVLQKGASYALVTFFMFGFYVLTGSIAETFFRRSLGGNAVLVGGFSAVFIVLAYQPLAAWFVRLSTRFFIVCRYDYHSTLRRVFAAIQEKNDFNSLFNLIVGIVLETMCTSRISLLIPDQSGGNYKSAPIDLIRGIRFYKKMEIHGNGTLAKWFGELKKVLYLQDLEDKISKNQSFAREFGKSKDFFLEVRDEMKQHGMELFVPIAYKSELKGILALGPKLSGDIYTSSDISLLTTVASHVAAALENISLSNENAALKKKL